MRVVFPQAGSANYRYLSIKKNYRIRGVPFHRPEEIKGVPFHRPWGVPFHRGKLPESRDFSTAAASRQSGGRALGLSATAGRLVGSTTMPPVAS